MIVKSKSLDTVLPKFAHKVRPENVLIKNLKCTDSSKGQYQSELIVDQSHSFLYDYPFAVDHVPGLVIIEAAKQMSCVVAHEYWDIPMEYAFAPLKASSKFIRFVELEPAPLLIGTLSYKSVMKGICLADMVTEVFQESNKMGALKSKFVFIVPEIYKKIRSGMTNSKMSRMIELIRQL